MKLAAICVKNTILHHNVIKHFLAIISINKTPKTKNSDLYIGTLYHLLIYFCNKNLF